MSTLTAVAILSIVLGCTAISPILVPFLVLLASAHREIWPKQTWLQRIMSAALSTVVVTAAVAVSSMLGAAVVVPIATLAGAM